jgi:flagellar assembly protein FliH
MNTSFSNAGTAAATEASPFEYTEVQNYDAAATPSEKEQADLERHRRQQAESFESGRQQGQRERCSEFDAALQAERQHIVDALQAFQLEREAYFLRVEREVVELALSIARKILYREAQIDANLLTGIVRITLEKLDAGTKVSLRVAPGDAADWRHYFACQADGSAVPEVQDDPSVPTGECRIETSVGTTTVGLGPQLKEIESGLFDILAERPGASARPSAEPKR